MSHPIQDQALGRRGRLARFALAGALSAGLLVAVPAAQADTLTTVRTHVHRADKALAKGINVYKGHVTYEAVAQAHKLEYVPVSKLL